MTIFTSAGHGLASLRLTVGLLPAMAAGVALGVVLMSLGCGAPLPLPQNNGNPDTDAPLDEDGDHGFVQFDFIEDDNPEVAALPFAEDELLARILPGAADDDLRQVYDEAGVTLVDEIPAIQTAALSVDPKELGAAATALSRSPLIESIHKSYFYDVQQVPNDPQFSRQTHHQALGTVEAWEITTGDENMVIAILDTGVEPTHPDLEDRLVEGWNVFDDNSDTGDVLGHGTGVAGSAAAGSNNEIGVAGVTWDNPIMPVRISSERGRASSRNIAAGIVWAVDHGAKIINVSFAPLSADATVLAAAQYARNSGALVFISAGNSGKALKAKADDNAVFVGAVDESGDPASFSDTGPFVDFTAPGTRIRTTATDGNYRPMNGTSFASPLVAGVAALVWSVNPDFRPATVVDILADSATDFGDPGRDDQYGIGVVDAGAAVQAALEVIEPADDVAPTVRIIEPDDMELVSRFARVSVGAFDAVGLADVVLSVDGVAFATDTARPFRFTVGTAKLAGGVHTLSVAATDLSGNSSEIASVRIRVEGGLSGGDSGGGGDAGGDNDGSVAETGDTGRDAIEPLVTINSPVDGSRVFTSVGIQATATDNVGLRSVEWLVDGVRRESESLSGTRQVVNFVWNASAAVNGPHRITVRVQDISRNEATATVTLIKE